MQIEIRADRKSMVLSGYVNVVGRDSRTLHDKTGPYIEQITPGAFRKSLKERREVELRFNHDKLLSEKDMELREDNIGLKANVTVTDQEVIAAAENKELRGWSFAFVKKKDRWKIDEDGTRRRFLDELELREVAVLTKTPAYIATSIEARGEEEVLVEFRAELLPEEGDAYIRQRETSTQTSEKTITPQDESVLFCVQKTIEIYKVKRRM